MGSGVFDANGILRVGPDLEGAALWTVANIDDTDSPFSAETSDFIVVGDLADDLTINLPETGLTAGDQIAVKLSGDPDGNTVTVDSGAFAIDDAGQVDLTVRYQQLYLVWIGPTIADPTRGWAILESGEGVAEVFSVFAATGNVLNGWSLSGQDMLGAGNAVKSDDGAGHLFILDPGDQFKFDGRALKVAGSNGGNCFLADATNGATTALDAAGLDVTAVDTFSSAQIISSQASAPADGTIAVSSFTFWLDATNGAPVFHIKAKQANGTVVGAAIPLA